MRVLFVPQFPSELRYQEWWFSELPNQFKKRGIEVLTLGEKFIESIQLRRSKVDMFSPINQAIEFETEQIKEYMSIGVQDDDILFLADTSFPGLFVNTLYHKRCKKMYAFCHATSLNKHDYFSSVRFSKYPVETFHATLFDTIFVGSKYHKDKLTGPTKDIYWQNTKVTYLPFHPAEELIVKPLKKTIDIMSASRPSIQKVDSQLESYIEGQLNVKIQRPVSSTWFNYYWNLNSAKILLITAHEDTFGYQIVDAIRNHCIPIARNSLAYTELLPRQYLYETREELLHLISGILNGDVEYKIPELLCKKQMNEFYDVICEEMSR